MRHSRSREFDAALRSGRAAGGWRELSADPNAAEALLHRADALRAAWSAPARDRAVFLESRCRGRRVLDVGCVAHDVARMDSPLWLHARLAAVSASCVGVDVDRAGILAMRERGFDVLEHDLGAGLGPLANLDPFEVIVAGELIEHVESLGMLFDATAVVLAPGGELIITTPNPYAPHRVRAARRGIVWENVDHILYAFPSGIAELAERHGLRLESVIDTAPRSPRGVVPRMRDIRRRVRGAHWVNVGYSTDGPERVLRVAGPLANWRERASRRLGGRLLGETVIYVIRRPDVDAGE